jgi:hypothetical protein
MPLNSRNATHGLSFYDVRATYTLYVAINHTIYAAIYAAISTFHRK